MTNDPAQAAEAAQVLRALALDEKREHSVPAPDRIAAMAGRGHPTREYVVFGTEWWLSVRNRLAEDPNRLFQALADAAARPPAGRD